MLGGSRSDTQPRHSAFVAVEPDPSGHGDRLVAARDIPRGTLLARFEDPLEVADTVSMNNILAQLARHDAQGPTAGMTFTHAGLVHHHDMQLTKTVGEKVTRIWVDLHHARRKRRPLWYMLQHGNTNDDVNAHFEQASEDSVDADELVHYLLGRVVMIRKADAAYRGIEVRATEDIPVTHPIALNYYGAPRLDKGESWLADAALSQPTPSAPTPALDLPAS